MTWFVGVVELLGFERLPRHANFIGTNSLSSNLGILRAG